MPRGGSLPAPAPDYQFMGFGSFLGQGIEIQVQKRKLLSIIFKKIFKACHSFSSTKLDYGQGIFRITMGIKDGEVLVTALKECMLLHSLDTESSFKTQSVQSSGTYRLIHIRGR